MARKRKSKPTSKERRERQKLKRNYARLREDAQLAGLIPTVPEGSVRTRSWERIAQQGVASPNGHADGAGGAGDK